MKLQVLVENTTERQDLRAEHGLSLYLEVNGHRILFDTGQSEIFAENAETLGIELSDVDVAVLSHGHYDHSGGLQRFLKCNSDAMVYVSPYFFEKHYNASDKYIGVDPALSGHKRLHIANDGERIGSGLTLFSCIHNTPIDPLETFGLTVEENGVLVPEDFRHEQYLMIEEGDKRVLISGCSHKGIINLAHWFQPDVLIGGFHFMKLDPKGQDSSVLDRAAQLLLKYPTVYYTGHCTGEVQFDFMKIRMGERLQKITTGSCLVI